MRVVILSARPGWHTGELVRALGERGHVAVVLPYERLVARLGGVATGRVPLTSDGTPILEADAVLARIIPSGSLEQIIYRVDVLHWIEERGIPVVNSPGTIERAVDKFYTTALLAEAGLAVPTTIVCETAADAVAAVREMGTAILKPLFGSMGHGMVRVDDAEIAWRAARTLEQTRAVFYVQQAVAHHGFDVRVLVAGGRVVGAITRHARAGEWRTNVAQGATVRPCAPSAEWTTLALQAAAAVQADYAGVDLLPATDGRVYVLEVNAVPAWQGVQQATSIDVAGVLVDRLLAPIAARANGIPS